MRNHFIVKNDLMPQGVNWMVANDSAGDSFLFVREGLCDDTCDAGMCAIAERACSALMRAAA